MTAAESRATGAREMSWFQAAWVGRDGARGESEAGGSGKTGQEPREGYGPRACALGVAPSDTNAAAATTARIRPLPRLNVVNVGCASSRRLVAKLRPSHGQRSDRHRAPRLRRTRVPPTHAPQGSATLKPRGGRSSAGRAPGCGPGGRRFESGRPPFVDFPLQSRLIALTHFAWWVEPRSISAASG